MAAGELLRTGAIASATVLVPRISLRDHEWPEAFRKFGYAAALSHITFACFQTAHRWKTHTADLLIVDECHMSLADKFYRLYGIIQYKYLLCLTGTLPEDPDMLERLEALAPVVSRCSMQRAEQLGIIARDTTVNLGVPLTEEEQVVYDAMMVNYRELVDKLGGGDASIAYQLALDNIGNYENDEIRALSRSLLQVVRDRKLFLSNTTNKRAVALGMARYFKDKRIFLFCEDIAAAEDYAKQLGPQAVVYHSEMSPKERKRTLALFREGRKRIIVSVRALNVGVDVPDADLGIAVAGSSKSSDDTQRRGRVKRFEHGKRALYYNLYALGTQDERWVSKRTKKVFHVKWQQYIPGEDLGALLRQALA